VKKTTRDVTAAAVEALVQGLPTASPLVPRALDHGADLAQQVADAVVASFVGTLSADVAVALANTDALTVAAGTDSPFVSIADILRPALEGATAVLGVGVLGEASVENAAALFASPESKIFELTESGNPAGWFAIRLRDSGVAGRPAEPARGQGLGKLSRISNVEMTMTVEIGRTRMSVRDVLALEPGAVIELDRSAGAPADVLLNGRLIAHGEVVVVDQDYAVRITKILDVDDGLS
jgi:flagellar motor switch protein FliN